MDRATLSCHDAVLDPLCILDPPPPPAPAHRQSCLLGRRQAAPQGCAQRSTSPRTSCHLPGGPRGHPSFPHPQSPWLISPAPSGFCLPSPCPLCTHQPSCPSPGLSPIDTRSTGAGAGSCPRAGTAVTGPSKESSPWPIPALGLGSLSEPFHPGKPVSLRLRDVP